MSASSPSPIRRVGDPDTITVEGTVLNPITVRRRAGPLATLLGDARVQGDHGTVHSGDGLFLASIPLEILRHAMLTEEGRLSLPDPPTKCWLVKDVRLIEITDGRRPDSLPEAERAKT